MIYFLFSISFMFYFSLLELVRVFPEKCLGHFRIVPGAPCKNHSSPRESLQIGRACQVKSMAASRCKLEATGLLFRKWGPLDCSIVKVPMVLIWFSCGHMVLIWFSDVLGWLVGWSRAPS